MKFKVIIPGGSGFLGTALAKHFSNLGWDVVILSRKSQESRGSVRTVLWDGKSLGKWVDELESALAIINLAGRSVACLDNEINRKAILDSRVDAVNTITAACNACLNPPRILVQASTLAIYGNEGEAVCNEESRYESDFLAEVTKAWETAFFNSVYKNNPRLVAFRIGFILGPKGGALAPLSLLTRLFLGGTTGTGKQYISWTHINDFCRMCQWAIETESARNQYNACSPEPVTNKVFMKVLRKAYNRPWSPPAPAWAVKLISKTVIKVNPDLALKGRACVPQRLLNEGFKFTYTDLLTALKALLIV
jgi:uncharacterized protein (TIGR01777 family)